MRKLILMTGLLMVIAASTTAQAPDASWQGEMAKLRPMVGEWKGEGWMERGPQGRATYLIEERVEEKTGGRALLIQGLGREKDEAGEGKVIHDALAVVSWDPKSAAFRFDAHTAQAGRVEATLAIAEDGAMTWGFTTPRGEVRYTIRIDATTWIEIGEFQPQGGETWTKFLEMNLKRMK